MARPGTQRKRDAVRTKAAILDAAISEFAERGPAGTRMDEVASRAAVNKSLIYQYFGSKSELYAEALNSVLNTITQKAAEHSVDFAKGAQTGDLRTYVRRYVDSHITLLEAMPEYPRLMAWENLDGGRTLARLPLQATYQAFLQRLTGILGPLRERGLLRQDFDLPAAVQAVMALTHYFVIHRGTTQHLFQRDPHSEATREAWLDQCTDMLVASLQAR